MIVLSILDSISDRRLNEEAIVFVNQFQRLYFAHIGVGCVRPSGRTFR